MELSALPRPVQPPIRASVSAGYPAHRELTRFDPRSQPTRSVRHASGSTQLSQLARNNGQEPRTGNRRHRHVHHRPTNHRGRTPGLRSARLRRVTPICADDARSRDAVYAPDQAAAERTESYAVSHTYPRAVSCRCDCVRCRQRRRACRCCWPVHVRRGLGADSALHVCTSIGRRLGLGSGFMKRAVDLGADLPLCRARVADAAWRRIGWDIAVGAALRKALTPLEYKGSVSGQGGS